MRHSSISLVTLGLLLCVGAPAAGQGVNGRARTFISYFQVRQFLLDSVSSELAPGEGVQRELTDGTRANCGPSYCQYYRSGPEISVIPILQDVELNVWTGITGLRGYAHFRGRIPQGDKKLWPRSEENFEAVSAYVEYSRSFYRIQAGRIWQTTALGFFNYDGGSLALQLPKGLAVDLYGGLALVRGLNQRHSTALISSVESLEPRFDSYLGGIHARWRPTPGLTTSVTYQQEGTRRANDLYSERVAGSARILLGSATFEGELKYDLAGKTANLARLRVSAPLGGGFRGHAEVRKYVPYFELWTIWGAFSPVGFQEAQGRLDWVSSGGRLSWHAYSSHRKYEETHAKPSSPDLELRDDGWRLGAGLRLSMSEDLILSGEYRRDVGFGASGNGGDLSLQRFIGTDTYIALQGTAIETFSEFRVGSGQVIGGGILGQTRLGPASVRASAMLYRHRQTGRPSILDLNQARMHLTIEIPIGKDPGVAGRRES
jgi:hypothetical protein